MTPPKRWPTDADVARIQSISLCEEGIRIVKECVDRDLSLIDILKRLVKVIDILRQIQRVLRSVGPREPHPFNE
jgi:hypothetical protein